MTIWILGDQLTHEHSALASGDKKRDRVLLIESRKRGAHLRYHKIKLAMVYSAMRHFAGTLREEGWVVDYHELTETEDFVTGVRSHFERHGLRELVAMHPNSVTEQRALEAVARKVGTTIVFTPPVQFLRDRADFIQWAHGRKRLLMETHYRHMRQALGVLVDAEGNPEGGTWNLDAENRHTVSDWAKASSPLPPNPPDFEHDDLTRQVIADVELHFPKAPGRAAALWLPVTRQDALHLLEDFVQHRLPHFGAYEDLMLARHPRLFHSLLSAPINIGLLTPAECVRAAVTAYHRKAAPLNAVEGFVRQILGWREFINGVYWLKSPAYAASNALGAQRPLPEFFYTGDTDLRCLRSVLAETRDSAYNHHIQRLMILGNFMLLAGINPQEGLRWFSEMYVDAFEWVMAANVLGMSLHADGGFMATKPYAASASYISKMSDYCHGCRYKPTAKTGPDACPYNLLYWNFFDQHANRFASNPRTAVIIKAWQKRSASDRQSITQEAQAFLDRLGS